MLMSEPKLCPSCLTITFLSAAYFVSCLSVLSSSALTGLSAPKALGRAIGVALCLLLGRHLLVLGGYVSAGEAKETTVPSIVGQPLSRYVPTLPHPEPGLLYVVTLDGCSHCQRAERDLQGGDIRWRDLPICSIMHSGACFDGGALAFPAPMLLLCDKSGHITYQHEGWSDRPQDVAEIKSQVLAMQRRTNTHL